jgi:putative transposase
MGSQSIGAAGGRGGRRPGARVAPLAGAAADGGRSLGADRGGARGAHRRSRHVAQPLPPRRWDTRAGELELRIPKLRQGSYFPRFWSRARDRSRRSWRDPAGLCVRGLDPPRRPAGRVARLRISPREVSRVCAQLDEQVEAFRQRPLRATTPTCGSTRRGSRGRRRPGGGEGGGDRLQGARDGQARDPRLRRRRGGDEAFWSSFLRSLIARGLSGVQLVVSDAHEGLKAAIARLLRCPWQRCGVHFRCVPEHD